MSLARARLQEERRAWRKSHPHGFSAKPETNPDGTQNLLRWRFSVPATESSIWSPGVYDGVLVFSEDYPELPPNAFFDKIAGEPLFHPNVFLNGQVCLSLINQPGTRHGYGVGGTWSPAFGVKNVLLALQKSLDEASGYASGRDEAYRLFNKDRPAYEARVKKQVAHAVATRVQ